MQTRGRQGAGRRGILIAIICLGAFVSSSVDGDTMAPFVAPQVKSEPAPAAAPAAAQAPVTRSAPTIEPTRLAEPSAPQPQPAGTTQPLAQSRIGVGRAAFPSAPINGPALVFEKHAPLEVRPNQEFTYKIRVINPTNETLRNVVVTDALPAIFRFKSSVPEAVNAAQGAKQWKLGDMAAGTTKEINVTGSVTKLERLVSCVTVTHDVIGCWAINVAEPELHLAHVVPAVAVACDPIPIQVVVTNKGTGIAQGVKVTHPVPEGLQVGEGENVLTTVTFDAGDIPAGESRKFEFRAKPATAREYAVTATATSAGGLSAKSSDKFKVVQPKLTIKKSGRDKQLIGRQIDYVIEVENKGDGVARNTIVRDQLPGGVRIVGASEGAKLNKQSGEVVWELGELQPKESKKVSVTIVADTPSDLTNTAHATAFCAEPVSAQSKTKVTGVPAILLEVIDVEDPVEVAKNVTYIITVTNQGTATGTNIKINALLENGMQFVSAGGATAGVGLESGQVVFDPLPSLNPKAKASWKVVVKAMAPGDMRFKVLMNSDQISRDVVETEATNFYE